MLAKRGALAWYIEIFIAGRGMSLGPPSLSGKCRGGLDAVQVGRARVAVAEALDQLVPHRAGFLAEGLRVIHLLDVPVAGLDFLRELAGLPADEAGEVAGEGNRVRLLV